MTIAEAVAAIIEKMEFEHQLASEARVRDQKLAFDLMNQSLDAAGRPRINTEEFFAEIDAVLGWHPILLVHTGDSGFDGEGDTYLLNINKLKLRASNGLKLLLAERLVAVIQAAAITKSLQAMMKERLDTRTLLAPAHASFDTALDALLCCRSEEDLVSALHRAKQIMDWGRKESSKLLAKMMGIQNDKDET